MTQLSLEAQPITMCPGQDVEAGTGDVSLPRLSFKGRNSGKYLVWSKVNLKLVEKKGSEQVKKHILQDVWGRAQAGMTTAIMGASGAGSKFADLL
jgi:hypothetical protein